MKSIRYFQRVILNLGVLCLVLPLVSTSQGDNSGCGAEKIVENRKQPIKFSPFPMSDPETGKSYHPHEEITILLDNGEKVKIKAGEFFGKLNKIEETLSTWGYSVRDVDQMTLARLNYCSPVMEKQAAGINKQIREYMIETVAKDPEEWEKTWDEMWKEYVKNLPSWDDLYKAADNKDYKVYLPPVPVFTAVPPKLQRAPLKFEKEKRWSFAAGSKRDFYTSIEPYVVFRANKIEAYGEAGVNWSGSLMDVWQGEIAKARLTAESPGSGPMKVDLKMSLIDGKQVWSKPLVKEGVLSWGDRYTSQVAQGVDYRFAIGPIPMKAEVGFLGEAGFEWRLDLMPLQAGVYAMPWIAAKAYVQAGADIAVGGAGAGGQLNLIEEKLNLQGRALFEYLEQPQITLEAAGLNELNMLNGELYAYAYLYHPVPWPPWKKRWEGRYDFFNWEGISKKGNIFDYRARITPSGITADGDLAADDLIQVNQINSEAYIAELTEKADKQLADVVKAIVNDLATDKTGKIILEREKLVALNGKVLEEIQTYEQELKQWLID